MKKSLYSLVVFILIISMFSSLTVDRADAATTSIKRLGGADRFEVAVNISKQGWSSSNKVIISSYNAFADALTATPLAYKNNAPILLTQKERLTAKTRDEIKRLGAKEATIIGGTASVSSQVEKDLRANGVTTIKRIGGKDRFEVSKNIAAEFSSASKVVLAYSHNFPDALAIGSYAAEKGYPILLTATDRIPDEIKTAAFGSNVQQAIIVGGPNSVGDAVFNELKSKGKNPYRIGGKDRYEVSANIVKEFYSTNKAYIATGLSFADALTGSVLAAKQKAPILLSYPNYPVPVIQNAIFQNSMFDLTVLGGPVSVPEATVKSLISYRKAVMNNDGTLQVNSTNYDSIDSVSLSQNNEVVVFGNQVVKMRSGMVYATPSYGNSIVKVYATPTATSHATYVAPKTEMSYISADEKRVKVQVADFQGYVDQKEINMVPWNAVKVRASYYVSGGNLLHKIGTSSAVIGKAPSFLAAGTTYYSWDGYSFYSTSGKLVGKHKQYFQHLPIRTKTVYTADQLLSYINNNNEITSWETRTGRKSPLRDPNLINEMIKAQADYGINALFILSAAIHESAWGVSDIATAKKNLYGIKAYDSNPESAAEGFSSFNASVIAFAKEYMAGGYSDPTDWRYNGGVPGHKGLGINRQYASDPYWGSRVAGHMYKIDKALGSKDYGNYQLRMTNQWFNVRNGASTTATFLYKYPSAGIPIALPKTGFEVTGSSVSENSVWYKIISETSGNDAYIHSSGVSPLN